MLGNFLNVGQVGNRKERIVQPVCMTILLFPLVRKLLVKFQEQNNISFSKGSKICHPKMSLGRADYFKLKTIKAQKTQEETLTFSLTA